MKIRWMMAVALLALARCAAPEVRSGEAPVAAPVAAQKISGDEARKLVAQGAALVDVRGPSLFEKGHIAGAINIPVTEIGVRAAEIGPKDRPVVLYCRTGTNSALAAQELRNLGFTNLYDLGSYTNWGEGAPVDAAVSAETPAR